MSTETKQKLWIINPFTQKVCRIAEDDPRLERDQARGRTILFKSAKHPSLLSLTGAPFWHRRAANEAWKVVDYCGKTETELCDAYNARIDLGIERRRSELRLLEQRIQELEESKMRPKGKR
jgi:hypothetical protein